MHRIFEIWLSHAQTKGKPIGQRVQTGLDSNTVLMYLYTLQTSQCISIKYIQKRPVPEIRLDGVSHVPKPDGGTQFLRDVSERGTEELSILGEEAIVVDDSAAHDVVVRDVRAVGLPVFAITSNLSGRSVVGERVLHLAWSHEIGTLRGKPYAC